jgi:hypothetical protein
LVVDNKNRFPLPETIFPTYLSWELHPSNHWYRSRFRQNGPASQHVRKEPAKNKFLVNFCFELTAQHLFSSDLPPSPKSLVVYTKQKFSLPKIIFPSIFPVSQVLQIIG